MTILYNRRSICMGDDVYNGIYKIVMPDDAGLDDLVDVLLHGGCGNTWSIPQTSDIGWVIYSNIGKIADVSPDLKTVVYCNMDKDTKLSALNIKWVFGERTGETPDISSIAKRFGQ